MIITTHIKIYNISSYKIRKIKYKKKRREGLVVTGDSLFY